MVGSTLTTVVVFAPLGLLSGVVGQFFRALSLTLSVAVLISLALSLTVVPLLARPFAACPVRLRPRSAGEGPLRRWYARSVATVVAHPSLAIAGRVGLAIATGRHVHLNRHRLPAARRRGRLRHRLSDAGGHGARGDRSTGRKMEAILSATPEVASYSRRTGSELGLFATPQNTGDILVRLKPRGERSRSSPRR